MTENKLQKKKLVIVESPAKARTISRFLGSDFVVESSIGHIRDLPSTAAEIPANVKNESWARLGVNVDDKFRPLYVIPRGKLNQVKKLRNELKNAQELYLATDEDREGEAIAWHLAEVLNPKVPVKRMVFDEITQTAIKRAVEDTRQIDQRLVNAQETRRILDRLFGYEVSPVLWRKIGPKLSAGRVQSVATRLIVDRERQRMQFVSAEYWDVLATLDRSDSGGQAFEARMVELGGKRVATGRDFGETTGILKDNSDALHLAGQAAREVAENLENKDFTVSEINQKPFTNRPYAPFITSTLQQEASRKLRFSAQRTMRLAQSLYENGYITYMRTDSTTLSQQAINAARSQVNELYGQEYLPEKPRLYASTSKNAQEAHEAIRPTGEHFRTPKEVSGELNQDELRIYELIWKRTVASQMKDATGLRTTVRIQADAGQHGMAVFTASGKVITFPGFWRAYVEGSDDPAAELEDQEKVLPQMGQGTSLRAKQLEAQQHFTQPPARYTEASLIRELEERGIGRPSTYASIIQTIEDRGYVWRKGSALVPSFTAFAVINLLTMHLPDLVDYDFTASMEDGLDEIANGQREYVPWLHDFYFGEPGESGTSDSTDQIADVGLKVLVDSSGEQIDPRAVSQIPIGTTDDGQEVVIRVGRYGPYVQIGDGEQRASVPEDIAPDEFTVEMAREMIAQAAQGDTVLGEDPETGKPVYLKTGRFGPYVQLGDPELTEKGTVKRGSKPKMASLWPTMSMETMTLEQALKLLGFPRTVGTHPESGEEITAQDGRYGPYLKKGDDTRSLESHEKLDTVTLDEAVELFKQPKSRGRQSGGQSVLADLGAHPDNAEAKLQVKNGRYGPYVTDGVVNATIPKGKDPTTVTASEAVELLKAREQKLRDQGKDPRAPKKSAKKGTRKTSSRKKSSTKKSTKKSG